MKIATLTLACALTATTALAGPVGFQTFEVDMPHHGRTATTAVFYPSAGGGRAELFADNAVFHGIELQHDAEIAKAKHPIVLMSHGMGGGIRPMAWLGAGLAKRGALVIAVKHPNSSWGDFDMTKGVQHWTRPLDMSRALDYVLGLPELAEQADTSRVLATGFSFGGWTALSLGGARSNHAGFVKACTEHRAEMSVCDRLLSEPVNLADQDKALWQKSYSDARVTQVVAIDPGLVWGATDQDVVEMVSNVSLIGLGTDGTQLKDADFNESGFGALLPDANITVMAPAMHFTAMPLCKPAGAAILEAEKDDPVCTDPEGTDRAAVHQAIVSTIATQLGL